MRLTAGDPLPIDLVILFQAHVPGRRLPPWWRWLKGWMKPGWHHCLVIFGDPEGGVWVAVDPLLGGIQVRCWPLAVTLPRVLAHYPATAYVTLPGVPRVGWPMRPRGLLTCVSVCKAIAGLRGWSITPWQLYRSLEHEVSRAQGRQGSRGGQGGSSPARG